MYKNFFKIAFRNLVKNKVYSFINIVGLAVGMTVTMLIGLWIYDELSFNQYHQNYDNIAQVYQKGTSNGNVFISEYLPIPLETELKEHFSSDFKYVVMSSWTADHILAYARKKNYSKGQLLQPGGARNVDAEYAAWYKVRITRARLCSIISVGSKISFW